MQETTIHRIFYKNINKFKYPSPIDFGMILFDSNLACNLHCVYCHNNRSTEVVNEEDFKSFVNDQVKSIKSFQIGCAMEPTMDKRMNDFIKVVGKSHARPTGMFRIQTNGILLHRHDHTVWEDCGVNTLSVSIDTIDPEVHKVLRGGSDIKKIIKNIEDVRKKCPNLKMWFITTVSSDNINLLSDLIKYGVDIGVSGIELRKMYYLPSSVIIKDHEKMKSLLLTNEKFNESVHALKDTWHKKINFYINYEDTINSHIKKQIV